MKVKKRIVKVQAYGLIDKEGKLWIGCLNYDRASNLISYEENSRKWPYAEFVSAPVTITYSLNRLRRKRNV